MKPSIQIVLTVLIAFSWDVIAQPMPGEPTMPRLSWWHRSFGSLSWEEAVDVVKSPKNVCWEVRRHVSYRRENDEAKFSSGRTIWDRGYGDCKGISVCVADLCKSKGFLCWIAAVYPVGSRSDGHCIVMGIWHGQMWMASNGMYREVSSPDDVLKKLSDIKGFKGKQLEYVPLTMDDENGVSHNRMD